MNIKKINLFFLLILTSSKIFANSIFLNIPFIKPLEITLGQYYLNQIGYLDYNSHQNFEKNQELKIANFIFYSNQKINPYSIDSKYYQTLHYYYNSFYTRNSFISIELIPYFQTVLLPWTTKQQELNLRSFLSYGLNLNKENTLSAVFGLINDQRIHNQILYENEPIIEYGKVFFIPGIQLRSETIILKTFLEIPLYEYNLLTKTQKIYSSSLQESRANFQVQIKN